MHPENHAFMTRLFYFPSVIFGCKLATMLFTNNNTSACYDNECLVHCTAHLTSRNASKMKVKFSAM